MIGTILGAESALAAHRRLARRMLCSVALCALFGCHPAPKPVSPLIRIGSYLWPDSYWIEIATKKGWFAEAGLNVERVNVNHTYFAALDKVASGQLEALGFSQFDLVRHVAAGHDLVGVAAVGYSDGAEALVARAGIHQLRDLKGKRLALYRGTYMEYLLSIFAEREGLDLSEVALVDRSEQDSLDDFRAGRVDAVLVWEPYVSQALAAGGTSLFTSADFPGLTYSVLTLRRDFVHQHPDQVASLIRVWDRAARYVRENPDESNAIVAQSFHDPSSVQKLAGSVHILDLADNGRAFSYAAGFESLHGSWRRMNDFMLDRGLVGARVDSPTHLDPTFIRLLE
jgi:NitT/TauT family transport system substrate-binding protein